MALYPTEVPVLSTHQSQVSRCFSAYIWQPTPLSLLVAGGGGRPGSPIKSVDQEFPELACFPQEIPQSLSALNLSARKVVDLN